MRPSNFWAYITERCGCKGLPLKLFLLGCGIALSTLCIGCGLPVCAADTGKMMPITPTDTDHPNSSDLDDLAFRAPEIGTKDVEAVIVELLLELRWNRGARSDPNGPQLTVQMSRDSKNTLTVTATVGAFTSAASATTQEALAEAKGRPLTTRRYARVIAKKIGEAFSKQSAERNAP